MKIELVQSGHSLKLSPETDADRAQIAALFGLPGEEDDHRNVPFSNTQRTGKAVYSVDGGVEVHIADAWWNRQDDDYFKRPD